MIIVVIVYVVVIFIIVIIILTGIQRYYLNGEYILFGII